MVNKQQYQAYAAATHTIARTKQIVMLYDGAIRFITQAREAIVDKRFEDRYKMLLKASDVIMGLQGCLDFEDGGSIGRVLYNFYSGIDARIFALHHSNSLEACDELLDDLRKMRDVWDEIDMNMAKQSDIALPAAPTAENPPLKPESNVSVSA